MNLRQRQKKKSSQKIYEELKLDLDIFVQEEQSEERIWT